MLVPPSLPARLRLCWFHLVVKDLSIPMDRSVLPRPCPCDPGSTDLAIRSRTSPLPIPSSRLPLHLSTPLPGLLSSPSLGGAREARTPDPLLAKQVLSQLSYGPRPDDSGKMSDDSLKGADAPQPFALPEDSREATPQNLASAPCLPPSDMVGLAGVEPATSPLSGVRSNHLSYRPSAASQA